MPCVETKYRYVELLYMYITVYRFLFLVFDIAKISHTTDIEWLIYSYKNITISF